MNFVNKGTDDEILKSLPLDGASDDLIKAMGRQGLVQKEVQVKTKNGVITRKQWVKASQDQPSDKSTKKIDEKKQIETEVEDDETPVSKLKVGDSFDLVIHGDSQGTVKISSITKGSTDGPIKFANYHIKGTLNGKPYDETVSQNFSPHKVIEKEKPVESKGSDTKADKDETDKDDRYDLYTQIEKTVGGSKNIPKIAKKHGITWENSDSDVVNNTRAGFAMVAAIKSGKLSFDDLKSNEDTKPQSTVTTPKDKASLLQLLQSGSSREDIMSQAEKDGVIWKHSDHPGINWMRASMAMTGTSTKGSAKEEKATEPKTDKTSKSEKSVIGSDYTKLTTDDEAGTPEGEAHNMMVGRLKSKLSGKTPTETNIKGAAADLATATKHSLIMSARKEDIEHNTIMLNQFNKLAGNNYTMTHEDVLKDVLSSQSGASLEERGSAINKIMNEEGSNTYYNDGNGGVFSSNDNGAAVTIQPTARGNFKVSFAYSDGAKRSETYNKIDAVKTASEKFLKSN